MVPVSVSQAFAPALAALHEGALRAEAPGADAARQQALLRFLERLADAQAGLQRALAAWDGLRRLLWWEAPARTARLLGALGSLLLVLLAAPLRAVLVAGTLWLFLRQTHLGAAVGRALARAVPRARAAAPLAAPAEPAAAAARLPAAAPATVLGGPGAAESLPAAPAAGPRPARRAPGGSGAAGAAPAAAAGPAAATGPSGGGGAASPPKASFVQSLLESVRRRRAGSQAGAGPALASAVSSASASAAAAVAAACSQCRAAFNVLRRRHYCRHCGNKFCSSCCANQVPRALFGATAPAAATAKVRVCDLCMAQLQATHQREAFFDAPGSPMRPPKPYAYTEAPDSTTDDDDADEEEVLA